MAITRHYHQDKFATNVTSNQIAGVTTTPLNSIPSATAPFYIALDATNINGHYEVVDVTSKTATNINHAATSYIHSTDEEVRMVVPAVEMDAINEDLTSIGTLSGSNSTEKVLNTQCKVRASVGTNQANIGTSVVVVNYDTEQYDIGSDFNTTTKVFTAPVTGYYLVMAQVYLYDVLADQEALNLFIYKNGSAYARTQEIAAKANTGQCVRVVDIVPLTAADTLDIRAQMATTGTTDIFNDSTLTYLSIHLLSV